MSYLIAEEDFNIKASLERVWDLLGLVILRCLPLEKMDILNENNFSATLKVPLTFFHLSLNLIGSLELDPPNSVVCLLKGESKWKIVQTRLKVDFILKANDKNTTQIKCVAMREGKRRNIIELFLATKEERFTIDILNDVRKSLEQLA